VTGLLTIKDLHKYQVGVIAKGFDLKQLALFLDTGLGKTVIMLTLFDQLKKRGLITSMLVMAPKKVMYNVWRQEAQEWAHLRHLKFSVIHGDATPGRAEEARRRGFYTKADVYLINYEGIPWLAKRLHPYIGRHPIPYQMIVYDESTKMKHSTTKRYRAWKPFMRYFPYRFILTATPMANGISDLFGQMYLVDAGKRLGTTITSFRSRYLERIPTPNNFAMYREREGARDQVVRRITDRAIYLDKNDYLKLPPITHNPIWIDLPPKLRKVYDALEKEFFVELSEKKSIEVFNAGSLSMKLRQFLQGFVYETPGDGERTVTEIHTEKLDMLKERVDTRSKGPRQIEGIGNSILVYFFQHDRDMLRRVFPMAPAIDGRTDDTEVEQIKSEWDKRKVPVLLANSGSLNYGLNMQHGGNNIIWYAMTWNAEHLSQLIDRLHRQRQEKPVFIHYLLFRDTVEETIFQAVVKKNANQRELLDALRKRHMGE
jgi:SNF2 family DNA or RNA helicase